MLYFYKYNILKYSGVYYLHVSTHIFNMQCGFNEFTYVFNGKNLKIMLFRIHQINDKTEKNWSTLTRFGR